MRRGVGHLGPAGKVCYVGVRTGQWARVRTCRACVGNNHLVCRGENGLEGARAGACVVPDG